MAVIIVERFDFRFYIRKKKQQGWALNYGEKVILHFAFLNRWGMNSLSPRRHVSHSWSVPVDS